MSHLRCSVLFYFEHRTQESATEAAASPAPRAPPAPPRRRARGAMRSGAGLAAGGRRTIGRQQRY